MNVAYVAVMVSQTLRLTVTGTYSMSVAYVVVQALPTLRLTVSCVPSTHLHSHETPFPLAFRLPSANKNPTI